MNNHNTSRTRVIRLDDYIKVDRSNLYNYMNTSNRLWNDDLRYSDTSWLEIKALYNLLPDEAQDRVKYLSNQSNCHVLDYVVRFKGSLESLMIRFGHNQNAFKAC